MPPKIRKTKQKNRRTYEDFGAPAEHHEAGALPTVKDVIASNNNDIESQEMMTH